MVVAEARTPRTTGPFCKGCLQDLLSSPASDTKLRNDTEDLASMNRRSPVVFEMSVFGVSIKLYTQKVCVELFPHDWVEGQIPALVFKELTV